MRRLILLLAFLLLPIYANAAVIPVNPTDDLQVMMRAAKPDDILLVAPDPARQGGIWVNGTSGLPDHPITLRAAIPGTVTIVGATATRTDTLTLTNSHYWRVEGINFDGAKTARACVYLPNSQGTAVVGCEVKNSTTQGILASNSRGVLIENCDIHDITGSSGQHSIYISGGASASDCTVRNTRGWNIARAFVQGNAQGENTPLERLTIEGCSAWRCGLEGNQAAVVNFIGVCNSSVKNCYFYSSLGGGVSLSGVKASGTKPVLLSTGNLISSTDIMFNGGQGKQCVVSSDPSGAILHSSNSITFCNLRMGKDTVPAVQASGGSVFQMDGIITLPVAKALPVAPSPNAGTGGAIIAPVP